MEYLVRIIYKDGSVSVRGMAHSQLCRILGDAILPKGFWNGDATLDCDIGNVKLINQDRLDRAKKRYSA